MNRKGDIIMFCKNCGKELPEGVQFCGECGSAVEAAQPQAAQPQEDPMIVLNTQGKVAAPKKKWLIPSLVGAGLVLIAGIVLAVNFLLPPKENKAPQASQSAQEQNTEVNKENVDDVLESTGNRLEQWLEQATQDAGYEGKVRIVLGDALLSLMSTDMDMEWLSEIVLNYELTNRGSQAMVDMELGLGTTEITSMQYILDSEEMKMWMMIPDLSNQALFFDLAAAMAESDAAASSMMMGYDMLPTVVEAVDVLMPYVETFLDAFSEAERTTETVELEGISQELTVLKVEMTEQECVEVLIKILEDMREDEELWQIVKELQLDEEAGEYLCEEYKIQLNARIDVMKGYLEELDPESENVLYLHTYLNADQETVGSALGVIADGEEHIIFSYLTVKNGQDVASQFAYMDNAIRVAGSGTDNGKLSGTYYVYGMEEKYLKVELVDYDYDAEFATGMIRLTPQKALLDVITADMDESSKAMASMLTFELEIQITGNANNSKVSMTLDVAGMEFITIEVSGKVTQPKEIDIPNNAVDAMDEEALIQWSESLNQEKFMNTIMDRLAKAGMPNELLLLLGYAGAAIPL